MKKVLDYKSGIDKFFYMIITTLSVRSVAFCLSSTSFLIHDDSITIYILAVASVILDISQIIFCLVIMKSIDVTIQFNSDST